jgi:RNA polymerase sigma-70 factor (ECF subfamily)
MPTYLKITTANEGRAGAMERAAARLLDEYLAAAARAGDRAAVALFYLEDFSIAEVAAAMDVKAGTVKTRLMHARTRLRAALTGGDDDGRT